MNERYTRLRAAVDDAVKRGNIGGDYRTYDVGSLLCDHDALAARLAEAVAALHEIAHAHDTDARRLRLMAADALIRHNAADSAGEKP